MTTETPTVDEYMTPNPYIISPGADLRTARALMREKHIRHLPVEKDGELVGILSLGDVDLVQSFADLHHGLLTVAEAMTPDPCCVEIGAPLDVVAEMMAERRLGSVVVVDAERNVAGIFTAVDSLRLLARELRR